MVDQANPERRTTLRFRSFNESLYNAAGLNSEDDRTVIADPEATELNRIQATYESEALRTTLRVGRQQIVLDDMRFVGNVVWRQNFQTFDAFQVSHRPSEELDLSYYYVWKVHGIFGDGSSATFPNQRRDFDSDSHFFRASYSGLPGATLTAFAYLLDFSGRNSTARVNSSSTYGVRMVGSQPVADDLSIGYTGSYAYQVDGENNPLGYQANYWYGEASLKEESLGKVFAGYEQLGSNNGRAQFRTPLSTAHKFNGWADAFLDNGGPTGLEDFIIGVSPKLTAKITGSIVYHKFNKADGGGNLGWELDAEFKRPLAKSLVALIKYAYFEGPEDPDIFRFWFQLTFSF